MAIRECNGKSSKMYKDFVVLTTQHQPYRRISQQGALTALRYYRDSPRYHVGVDYITTSFDELRELGRARFPFLKRCDFFPAHLSDYITFNHLCLIEDVLKTKTTTFVLEDDVLLCLSREKLKARLKELRKLLKKEPRLICVCGHWYEDVYSLRENIGDFWSTGDCFVDASVANIYTPAGAADILNYYEHHADHYETLIDLMWGLKIPEVDYILSYSGAFGNIYLPQKDIHRWSPFRGIGYSDLDDLSREDGSCIDKGAEVVQNLIALGTPETDVFREVEALNAVLSERFPS